jgi:hypothetical protein
VYRGLSAYCSACGTPRLPLANASVTHAGQPAKVGGAITRVLGWLVLAGGWLVAAVFAGLLALLSAPTSSMLVVFGTIGVVGSIVAYALLRGGKHLTKVGDDAELTTKRQAIFALAANERGVLTPWNVARGLQVSVEEGDRLLTALAKEAPDQVTVDIDGEGNVLYRFQAISWNGLAPNDPRGRVRVAPPQTPQRVGEIDEREEEMVASEPIHQRAR